MIIIVKSVSDFSHDASYKLRALENLLCAYGEGRHVLWMPVEVVELLILEPRFSEFAKRVLYELKSAVLETRKIENLFAFHVEIDFDNSFRFEGERSVLKIGYRKVVQSGMLQKAIFLTENLRDAQVYFTGAEVFMVKNRLLASYQVGLDLQPGGGSTTFDLFEKLRGEEKLFLCLIDSDKEHPRGPLGSTAKRFNGSGKGLNTGYYLEILPCHEIENIIPVKIVKEVLSKDFEMGALFAREDCDRYRKYPDYKFGLNVLRARLMDETHQLDFWRAFYDLQDEEWLCAPMGEGLLDGIHDFMGQLSLHKLAEYFDYEIEQEWGRITKIIASWGVGMKRSLV